jgi:lambda-carrageenase
MCRKHGGKKILLRNKNIYWNGTVYLDAWRGTFLEGKYPDIFVPSMEETNCRTQEFSLTGRVGLWMTEHFTQTSARVVADNVIFNRYWEWGYQNHRSHFLRSLAYQSSLGSDIFHINLQLGRYEQLSPLFELLERGAILIPKREEILSISDLCLGMAEPSTRYIMHGTNGHDEKVPYEPNQPPMVFDRMDSYWGGTPIPQHDFTYYAFGSRTRTLNFLPKYPYGLVCMIPTIRIWENILSSRKRSPRMANIFTTKMENGRVLWNTSLSLSKRCVMRPNDCLFVSKAMSPGVSFVWVKTM